MFNIGIIVNPYSGKDLRRITSQASNVSNNEKVIKVVRMINSMIMFGVENVYLMPDNYMLNANIASTVHKDKNPIIVVKLLDFKPTDRPDNEISNSFWKRKVILPCSPPITFDIFPSIKLILIIFNY